MYKELVMKSRSYRGYDENRRISREELMDIVDCARFAPSSINVQPFKYYLANDRAVVAKIQNQTGWARALPEMELPHKGMYPPAFIIICQDLRIGDSVARYQKDVGIVAQTMLLAATEKGLGGCMIGNYSAKAVGDALGLDTELWPVLLLAIGKPMERVILKEVMPGEDIAYYRDEADVHYVPKRRLCDIIIN